MQLRLLLLARQFPSGEMISAAEDRLPRCPRVRRPAEPRGRSAEEESRHHGGAAFCTHRAQVLKGNVPFGGFPGGAKRPREYPRGSATSQVQHAGILAIIGVKMDECVCTGGNEPPAPPPALILRGSRRRGRSAAPMLRNLEDWRVQQNR